MLQRTTPTLEVEPGDDAGLGLVEVLVAMLVFAIVAVSVAYSVTFTLTTTRDSKARQVALNLAAADIDATRAVGDPFDVHSLTQDDPSGQYTITRVASWVTETGSDAVCSASGGTLRYKRVNVTVKWDGMGPTAIPARADTLLAPASRINDASKGTIFISVLGADGLGLEGVTPTVSGTSSPIAEPTDSDGCSYVLGVTPGTYAVSLSNLGYLDTAQANPSRVPLTGNISVVAGQSTAFPFQFDDAGTFRTQYATNRAALPTPNALIRFPTALQTNFVSTLGVHTPPAATITDASGTAARSTDLFPFPAGYQAFAGNYTAATPGNPGCQVADPAAWAADATTGAVGQRGPGQSTAPGGTSAPIRIPMGIVEVVKPSGTPTDRTYLFAARQNDQLVAGQPACSGTLEYAFGNVLSSTATRVALPFGSWKLYARTSAGGSSTVLITQIVLRTPGSVPIASGAQQGLFVLDPRGVTP